MPLLREPPCDSAAVPGLSIDCLRQIACRKWDAFDALEERPAWHRIDAILLEAARRLHTRIPDEEVADYLVDSEVEWLGVDSGSGMRERAMDLVECIRVYLDTLESEAARNTISL